MAARTVTYASVRDSVLRRRGIDPTGTVSAKDTAAAADYITSAYKYCLEWHQWTEAIVTATVDCTNGLVTWADVEDASWWEFYSEDPRPYDSSGTTSAYGIEVKRSGNDGLWLKTELDEVFVRYIAAAPASFNWEDSSLFVDEATSIIDWELDPDYVGELSGTPTETVIPLNSIYLYNGSFYRCLEEDELGIIGFPAGEAWESLSLYSFIEGNVYRYADLYYLCTESTGNTPPSAPFNLLDSFAPLLAILAEATKAFALSYWYSSSQEHGQSATFRAQGEAELNKLFNRSAAS